MTEHRFFDQFPFTSDWYAQRERAPHLEQAEHQARLRATHAKVTELARRFTVRSVSDLGAGDGGLLSLLAGEPFESWGFDLQPSNVEGAKERGVTVTNVDVTDPQWLIKWGDLSVCTEMLEHLEDPHAFVKRIRSRLLVASSPEGETPECHDGLHAWGWDMAGYRALIEGGGYQVLSHDVIEGGFRCQLVAAVR